MAQRGMDTDQAANTARQFQAEANNIKASVQKVDSALQNTWWKGSDHDKFIGDWSNSKAQLEKARQLLETTGKNLDRQRQEQEATSSR